MQPELQLQRSGSVSVSVESGELRWRLRTPSDSGNAAGALYCGPGWTQKECKKLLEEHGLSCVHRGARPGFVWG